MLATPKKLKYGISYFVLEVQALYGYVLDQIPIYFDVTEDNSTDANSITIIKVEKLNMAHKDTISVVKISEVFSGVTAIGGSDNQLTVYQPVQEVQGLVGVVYEIIAAEEIITVGVVIVEVVDTANTNANEMIIVLSIENSDP